MPDGNCPRACSADENRVRPPRVVPSFIVRPTPAVQPRRPHDAPGRRRLQPLGQPIGCYAARMTITARVREGRLVLDEPTTLPEGTQVALLPLDPGDWLDDTERAALHTALRASDADVAAGRLMDAPEVLRSLRTP